jgi:hypothetical protein
MSTIKEKEIKDYLGNLTFEERKLAENYLASIRGTQIIQ